MNTRITGAIDYHMTCEDGKTKTGARDILEEKN
jgi:hypothetical protein